MKKRYLVLADGSVFEGYAFGADKECVGELVSTTSVVGYVETLTDPGYCGQIVMQTFPQIGNYGVNESDFEGKPLLHGYIVREYCDYPSNFRCEYDINTFLCKNNIPGLYGVDTRELANILREKGDMNAALCDEIPENTDYIKAYKIENAVQTASPKETVVYPATGEEKKHVVMLDFGARKSIVSFFTDRGLKVIAVPYNTSAEDILALNPDGVVISEGPGNPEELKEACEQIKKLFGKAPMFGICLGHQLMALADGGKTFKLKHGHRGGNQPSRVVGSHKTYVTSQDHGYCVDASSTKHGKESFVNVNDSTNEGMDYEELKAFSVQFNPNSCTGRLGANILFDKFMKLMEEV